MSVTEYRDRFLQLARYAPADVADDRKKQEHFMEGLEDYLQYALLNLRFDDFNHLVDSALNTERKHLEMEDKKRKIVPVASGSNTRPRLQQPQQYQPQYRPPQQYQQRPPQQYPPRQQQQAGQGPRLPAPPARAPPAPSAPQAPRQAAPPAGQQAQGPPRTCYHCGQPGHYANSCPRKAQAGQQGRPAQPRAPLQGRVNHVTAESAAEAPNVDWYIHGQLQSS